MIHTKQKTILTQFHPWFIQKTIETLKKYSNDLSKIITLKSFCYFLIAPTLCFQLEYPKTTKIRKWMIIKRSAELVVLVFAQIFVLLQFIQPVLVEAPLILKSTPFEFYKLVNLVG